MSAEGQAKSRKRREVALAFFLPIVLLAPFVNRAFNIDEPMFIWTAQQIVKNPFDYFGGYVERNKELEPMYLYNQNPPGFSYVLAVFGAMGGWSEPVMRLASLLAAGLCGLGTYLVASRFTDRPMLASAATVLTPAFLVSGATVMTDVALVACYVWSMYAGARWVETGRAGWLAGTVVLISIAGLMKYYGVTAAGLVVVYALMKRVKPGPWLAAFVVPVLVLAAFFWWSWRLYGVNLLTIAADVAQDTNVRSGDALWYREIVAAVFVGGCFAPIAFFAPRYMRPLALLAAMAIAVAAATPVIREYSMLQLELGTPTPYAWSMRLHLGAMALLGVLLVWLPVQDLLKKRDAASVVLSLWVLGALVFTTYINHLINARTLLPMVPALAILMARNVRATGAATGFRRAISFAPLASGAVLSMWVLLGDYAVAENGRYSAREAAKRAAADGVQLYYSGLWGFQYYVQLEGARVFQVEGDGWGDELHVRMQHGDLIAVSSDGRERWRPAPGEFEDAAFFAYPNRFGVATYHSADECGFYSHLAGILPYKFGLASREEYGLYRWTGPDFVPGAPAK